MGVYKNMKVFVNTNFTGHWPVGTSAVVLAETKEIAVDILNQKLIKIGLNGDAVIEETYELIETGVYILNDGNY
jgi:hypothetical protein